MKSSKLYHHTEANTSASMLSSEIIEVSELLTMSEAEGSATGECPHCGLIGNRGWLCPYHGYFFV